MEESLSLFGKGDPDQLSGNVLAYVGDAVYELMLRTWAAQRFLHSPDELHRAVTGMVNAGAQAELILRLKPLLTEEEEAVFRRGRNAKTKSAANHQSLSDYKKATGFEALIGWLYLKGQKSRIRELVLAGWPELGKEELC